MKVENINIGKVKANPSNPRTIRDDKFQKLVRSIQEFPQMLSLRPIVVNDDMVVLGGNMRLKACKEAGLKEVPVIKASDLTEEQQREFIIKDNVGFGEWDWDAIANEWDAEQVTDWGLDIPDFKGVELEAEEDDFEIPDGVKTDIVVGDLFEIGPHRLLCGDSTNSDDIEKLINGQQAQMVLTDPPYEIEIDYANILLVAEHANVFIFNNDRNLINQLKNSPLTFKKFFVFNHNACAIPQEGGNEAFLTHILISHETIGEAPKYIKGGGTRTVIAGEYRRSENHKHEKPNSLLSELITPYSNEGDLVVDLFLGSGATMVTADQLNRKCYGLELDPKNCQVIIDRMIKLDPTLEIKRNGQPYKNSVETV